MYDGAVPDHVRVYLPATVPMLASLRGDGLTATVALIHGWLYIVYVVVAFLLSQQAGWSLQFLLLMLLAGLVPFLIFWVEHRVVVRMRAEHAELR